MIKKIFKGIFGVAIFGMLVSIFLIMGVLYDYFEDRIKTELKSEVVFISEGIKLDGINYLNGIESVSTRITWMAPDGNIIYDNKADISTMENHLNRKEFKEALENLEGESLRYSDTLSEKMLYYAYRLEDGSVIRVSASQYAVWMLLLGMFHSILFILIIILIISAFFAFKLSKYIVKPINEINLEQPDLEKIYDEISPLVKKIKLQNKCIANQMEQLKRRKDEFGIITENMSEGLLVLDNKNEIIFCNTSAMKFFGIEKEIKNQNILTLNRSQSFRRAIGEAYLGQHSFEKLKLDQKTYELIVNPIFNKDIHCESKNNNDNDNIIGVILIMLDISEKEMAEKVRREFTSNVSHELKTPLTSIYGVSDMLMSGLVKPSDIKDFARDINNEAKRLINMVNDIIKISQLDENAPQINKEWIDLSKVAKEVIKRLISVADKRNISIEFSGERNLIFGVYPMIEEMVYNLCDNAIKYNKDNGFLKVAVFKKENKVVLSVGDSGIGISDKYLDRVFERFFCVDKSHSKKIGGTGLGLSIVKHGAEYHNAKIEIESEIDLGTTIKIYFPK